MVGEFSQILKDPRIVTLSRVLGAELYLVGGAVRNLLLGQPCADLDLASPLLPEETSQRLEAHGIRVIATGLKHQTVTALVGCELPSCEITTFRGAGMTPQGGVVPSDCIETDLAYRDFTVNALALNVETGALADPYGGRADLQNRVLRAVGTPEERFREDPLRVLRMVRIACELQFEVEVDTLQASTCFAEALTQTSVERIRDELSKMLLSTQPQRALRMLSELGLLAVVLPELVPSVGFEQNRFHLADVFTHTLDVVRRSAPVLEARLAALFHDVGKPATLSVDEGSGERHFFRHEVIGAYMTKDALKRLKYPNSVVDAVTSLVRLHMRPIQAGPGGLRRLLRDAGELYPLWRDLKEADSAACKIDAADLARDLRVFDEAMEVVKQGPPVSPLKSLAISGKDLLTLGFRQGPAVGETLRALHERVLDEPELNERELLIELARAYKSPGNSTS